MELSVLPDEVLICFLQILQFSFLYTSLNFCPPSVLYTFSTSYLALVSVLFYNMLSTTSTLILSNTTNIFTLCPRHLLSSEEARAVESFPWDFKK